MTRKLKKLVEIQETHTQEVSDELKIHRQATLFAYDAYSVRVESSFKHKLISEFNKHEFQIQLIIFNKVLKYAQELLNQRKDFNSDIYENFKVTLSDIYNELKVCKEPVDKIRFSEVLVLLLQKLLPLIEQLENSFLDPVSIQNKRRFSDQHITKEISLARKASGL